MSEDGGLTWTRSRISCVKAWSATGHAADWSAITNALSDVGAVAADAQYEYDRESVGKAHRSFRIGSRP